MCQPLNLDESHRAAETMRPHAPRVADLVRVAAARRLLLLLFLVLLLFLLLFLFVVRVVLIACMPIND